jgi:hypothetical protein
VADREIENAEHLAGGSKDTCVRPLDGLPSVRIEAIDADGPVDMIDPNDPNAIDQVADALAEIRQRMANSDG